jgi:hypothetical protein
MTKHHRKDHPMWKMIGEDQRSAEKVGEGRIMWILAGAGYGRRITGGDAAPSPLANPTV